MIFCWHDWSKWSKPYVDCFGGDGKLAQTRECNKCKAVEISRVRQPILSRSFIDDVLDRLKTLEKNA